jgi:hypothetical protein
VAYYQQLLVNLARSALFNYDDPKIESEIEHPTTFPQMKVAKKDDPSSDSDDGFVDGVLEDFASDSDEDATVADDFVTSVDIPSESLGTIQSRQMWGPFQFSDVTRAAPASSRIALINQIQVRCPFHKDPDDKSGTSCTRTLQYDNSSEDTCRDVIVRSLKRWCLDGRRAQHRACIAPGQTAHKAIPKVPVSDLADDAHLNAELRQALMASEWIQVAADAGVHDDSAETEIDDVS